MPSTSAPIGLQLRTWRDRRRVSQLHLSICADVSARHLSFIESGRAQPGRELILRLAEELEIPLRERNHLLISAGFAPTFQQRSFSDPSFDSVRAVLDVALESHKPFPAYVIDRYWNVVASNDAVPELYAGIAPELVRRPMNVVRMLLHPCGLAPRIVNFAAWRAHLLTQLRRQVSLTADPTLESLLREAMSFPGRGIEEPTGSSSEGVMVPLEITTELGRLSLLNATTVFGAPVDVTLEEIALEMLYPADAFTAKAVKKAAARASKAMPLKPTRDERR
jgi:transcriptional regulator with XRE-family HTH domain